MVNSNTKGKRGEREFAKYLRDHGYEARRGQQFAGGGDSPDVVTNIEGIHFEIKRRERFDLYGSLLQARNDANHENIPVVAHRRNKHDWVAVLRMEDFLYLHQLLALKGKE